VIGMFNIVLVHPEIPPNTGNVIRLAANTGCALHLVEPLGFSMEDKLLQRAGLDYHEYASVKRHASWDELIRSEAPDVGRMFAFTTRGAQPFATVEWKSGDWLVFGCETSGLPEAIAWRSVSPPVFDVLEALGRGESLVRILDHSDSSPSR